MAEQKGEEKKDKKPLNVMLILQAVFAVVNFVVVGGGAYMVYASTIGWHDPEISEEQLIEEKEKEETANETVGAGPLIFTLDKFTVNLNGEPRRTIRIEVNLEMLNKDGFEEIIDSKNQAQVKDRIVRILNDESFAELESIQGKLFLKDKIAMEVNNILDAGVVKDVFFSDFVVQ